MKYIRSVTVLALGAATAFACGGGSEDDMDDGSGGTSTGGSDDGTGGTDDGSGGSSSDGGSEMGGQPMGGAEGFTISAARFADGDELPDDHTCEDKEFGGGFSPELSWSGAPEGTEYYALVFVDTTLVDADLPRLGYHWAAYNIPATVEGIPRAMSAGEMPVELEGGVQFRAGPPVDEPSFFGPCPSWEAGCGNGAPRANDSYAFVLYAMGEELDVPEHDTENYPNYAHQLDEFFAENAIASTRLTAESDAAPSVPPAFCPAFVIESADFDDGNPMPEEATCEGKEFGEGTSPALSWSGAPSNTTHYALVFADTTLLDQDLPQFGYHWAAYNIPSDITELAAALPAGATPDELGGGTQVRGGNADEPSFFGPCPSWQASCEIGVPRSDDSYAFTLYAFDSELEVPTFDPEDDTYATELDMLASFFEENALAKTELTATSDAAPSNAHPACPTFLLTSEDFSYGGVLPDQYSCEDQEFADGLIPDLSWTGAPDGTTKYALVLVDLTLLEQDLARFAYHWVAWDIPSTTTSIPESFPEGETPTELGGGTHYNPRAGGTTEYFAPCPSWASACEDGPIRSIENYAFRLYAYDDSLTVPAATGEEGEVYVQDLDEFFAENALGSTALLFSSDAKPGVAPPMCE